METQNSNGRGGGDSTAKIAHAGDRRDSKVTFEISPESIRALQAQAGALQAGGHSAMDGGSGRTTPQANSRRSSLNSQGHAGHGARRRVSAKFESFQYESPETEAFLHQQESIRASAVLKATLTKWFVAFLIGVVMSGVAVAAWFAIHELADVKFALLKHFIDKCKPNETACFIPPFMIWLAINLVFVFIGAMLVTYVAPHAAGSGIPQIKCYLNGVRLPGLLSLKTLLSKAGGIVLSVIGGLACGKEGPMIHSGAIIASAISNAQSKLIKKDFKIFRNIRGDQERRDFVAAGAAAGVSAAFGAPIGGVLFSLEEGASWTTQSVTWRMVFSSMTATLFLNIFLSLIKGHPDDLSSPGLISFGMVGDVHFKTIEVPFFIIMAVIGGILGALFVQMNYYVTLARKKLFKTSKIPPLIEALVVTTVTALAAYVLMFTYPNCNPIPGYNHNATNLTNHAHHADNGASHPVKHAAEPHAAILHTTVDPHHVENVVHKMNVSNQHAPHEKGHGEGHGDGHGDSGHGHGHQLLISCPEGYYNGMAGLWFKTPEASLISVLHSRYDEWTPVTLVIFVIVYFIIADWTYGLPVSSGLFIPSLLIGAVWGRLFGIGVIHMLPSVGTNVGKYALIGAACGLGGTVRMTISLAVIMIECTGDITFSIPIMLSLIIAKWVGDFFNPGIYDLHIELMGIPLLGWDPPALSYGIRASDIMTAPVTCLRKREKVGRIMQLLEDPKCHNGFPVVTDTDLDHPDYGRDGTYGRLAGFILKADLERLVYPNGRPAATNEKEKDAFISVVPHMTPHPFSLNEDVHYPRVFRLFRGLGLRHLVIVNDHNEVVGMLTRVDVAQIRGESSKGIQKLERLEVIDY